MDQQNQLGEFDAKIVLLGNSGVGKTSLVMRYVQGQYIVDQASTIGASFMTKRVMMDGYKLKLQIWDTAGQERFKSMTPMYYRGAAAAILVYDITNPKSFEAVQDWVNELRSNSKEQMIIAIAGNKADLIDRAAVPFPKAKEYASSITPILLETSAKHDQGVEELFAKIGQKLVEKHKERVKSQNIAAQSTIQLAPQEEKRFCCF